jgi:hypothetical protein
MSWSSSVGCCRHSFSLGRLGATEIKETHFNFGIPKVPFRLMRKPNRTTQSFTDSLTKSDPVDRSQWAKVANESAPTASKSLRSWCQKSEQDLSDRYLSTPEERQDNDMESRR